MTFKRTVCLQLYGKKGLFLTMAMLLSTSLSRKTINKWVTDSDVEELDWPAHLWVKLEQQMQAKPHCSTSCGKHSLEI